MAHHDAIIEIAAALVVMAVAVWFVGPLAVVVVALLIYLPALGMWWYRRGGMHRERKLTK